MKIAYYYQGNKEYIESLLKFDLTILIDDERDVESLLKYNCKIKKIKYDNEYYDIVVSITDDLKNIHANKKVVISDHEEYNNKIYYYNGFDLNKILEKPKKEDITFSIVMPNYNNAGWIDKTIESILNQTYQNWKLYIIDDISTDNSIEVIKKYDDKRIELVQNEIKLYNGGSRNVGILKAKKENPEGYLLFIDSDDWWDNNNFLNDLNNFIDNEDLITFEYKWYMNNKIRPAGHFTYKNADDLFMTNGICCACWCKAVKVSLMPLFSFNTLMEDRVHWYRTMNRIKTYEHFDLYQVYVWNKMNSNSVTTEKEKKYGTDLQAPIEWNHCAYRHIADQLDLLNELTNEKWRTFIKNRIEQCKTKCNNNVFEQW